MDFCQLTLGSDGGRNVDVRRFYMDTEPHVRKAWIRYGLGAYQHPGESGSKGGGWQNAFLFVFKLSEPIPNVTGKYERITH